VTAPEKGAGRSAQKSPRRRAREFVVQGLYQHLVGGQDEAAIRAQAESVAGFDKADIALYATLLHEAMDDLPALRDSIAPHVDRAWHEVSPIERGILLLGACELRHHPETPYRVVINEAIELAKTFGGTDGHKFVNGILDKLAPLLRPNEAKGR
jgi:transcription antitermination protein NusB